MQRKRRRAKSCGKDARWKSPKNGLSHLAWKSRQLRGIPTFPQLRLLREINLKPDISCAMKTGHFNVLPTAAGYCEVFGFTKSEHDCKVIEGRNGKSWVAYSAAIIPMSRELLFYVRFS